MDNNTNILRRYNILKGYSGLSSIQSKIVKVLWRNHRYTRKKLVELTQLPRTTIFDNIRKVTNNLSKRGIVAWDGDDNKGDKKGRTEVLFFLTDEFKTYMDNKLSE